MSSFCEHETFKDVCGICHRNSVIEKQSSEIERLRALYDEAKQCWMQSVSQCGELTDEIERLRAALQKVESECDALMKLKEGETERDLTGYARGSYFAAKHLKACAALEDRT